MKKELLLLAVPLWLACPAIFGADPVSQTSTPLQRPALLLSSGWKFLKQDTAPLVKTDNWEEVSVPHTWNTGDGANGVAADPQYPEGYYRGSAWYARRLDVPADWKGKRVFIRFEGVSLVADVLVNDIPIGQHRGGFAAFCYELTPYLHFDGKDSLRVRVDNARAFDIAPLSGDFTIFGGIYRPVTLFATDEVCVSPLKMGSPGLFLTVKRLDKSKAAILARTLISNGGKTDASVQVQLEVDDATGKPVLKRDAAAKFGPGQTSESVQELTLPNPHLWNGRKDPYLYSATVRLVRDGKVLDELKQPLGIRTVAVSQEKGFLLNGEPYALHGVNRHQERVDKGWAISDADQEEDHALIEELGATTVRLAHYQQADKFHELSDRTGIIEWQEIPLVDTVSGSPEFLANARQQLEEMILQGYNHPSIAMWGLFNELDASWAAVKTAPAPPIIDNLNKLAKELDSTRLTVGASLPQDPTERHRIPEWVAWNIYPGWYGGDTEEATKLIDNYSQKLGGKRVGLSEYGAGANPAQFQETGLKRPSAGGPFHPQEWQNHFHERLWAQCKDNPKLFGTWVWAMFDFACDKRNEGSTPGINDKGLVTRDRKTRKDTFFFYKANWNPEPTLYIASRRMTPRTQAETEVKVYTNCSQVELKVNGQSLGKQTPDNIKVARWTGVKLVPGKNTVEVSATVAGKPISDRCEWELQPGQ